MTRLLAFAFSVALVALPLGGRAAEHATQRVSGKAIARIASTVLTSLPVDAEHAFVPATAIGDQIVDAGSVELRLQTPVTTATYVDVPVAVAVNGEVRRVVYVGYRLQQFMETAVAARDLVPGAVLSADDLTMARVPFTGRGGNGIDALVGRRINAAVVHGQPVTIEYTSPNQLVKPGATVVMTVRDGGVALTADVVARTGGALGDEVFVYNPSTRKALSGTVTGPNAVELDISAGDAP